MDQGQGDSALMLEHSYGGSTKVQTEEAQLETTARDADPPSETKLAKASKTLNDAATKKSLNENKVQPCVVVLMKPSGQEVSIEPDEVAGQLNDASSSNDVAVTESTDDCMQVDENSVEDLSLPLAESEEVKKKGECDAEFPFVCGICQEKFSELAAFCTHVKSHENVEKYFHSCQDQKKKVLEALNIVENVDSRLFQCGICSTFYPSMCQLHEHMLKDEKMKDYKYSNEERTAYANADSEEESASFSPRAGRKRKDTEEVEYRVLRKKRKASADDYRGGNNSNEAEKQVEDEGKDASTMETPVKRGRGRPRKSETMVKSEKIETKEDKEEDECKEKKRGRGRPRLSDATDSKPEPMSSKKQKAEESVKTPRGRGRPRKSESELKLDTPTTKNNDKSQGKTPKTKSKTQDKSEKSSKKAMSDLSDEVVSPRANTSYGLRGKRKINKRYSDYITDVSWIKKEVVTDDVEDEEVKSSHEEECEEEIQSDASNFEEILEKELEEKEKKRQAKVDKAQKVLMALDGTEYLVDDDSIVTEALAEVERIEEQNEVKRIRTKPRRVIKQEEEIIETKLEQRTCEKCKGPYFLPPGVIDETNFVHNCLAQTEECLEVETETDVDPIKEADSFLEKNLPQNTKNCSICNKTFADNRRLKRHVLTHLKTKNIRCNLCGKTFKLRAYLNDHKRFYHKLSAPERKALESVKYVGSARGTATYINPTHGSYDAKVRKPCPICGKHFENKRMRRHMICHLSARNIKCDKCPKRFKCGAHMRDHKKLVHQLTILRCTVCRRVFRHYKSLERHLAQHVRKNEIDNMSEYEKKYIEVVKGTADSSSQTEKEYLKDEEENDELDGGSVDEMVDQLMSLGDTMYEKGNRIFIDDESVDYEYSCEYCGRRFETADAVSTHVDIHPDPKVYDCYICERNFNNVATLKRHMLIHVAMRRFFCDKCGAGFKSSHRLKDHCRNAHVSGREYVCNICGDTYKSEQTLWTHKNLHLKVTNKYYSEEVEEILRQEESQREVYRLEASKNPKMIVCEDCGKEVIAKRYFRHKDTHKRVKDIQCDMCPKKFTSYRYMKDHKSRTHFAQKTDTCEICGLMFKAGYIEKHRLIHGPKDKMCTLCGKGFTTDFYLKIHMGTHEAKKRMKCPECDARFSHKSRLDIHLIEKHGHGEQRPCKYCELMFPSRQKARMHERKMHEGYKLPYRDKTKYRYKSLVSHNLVSSALPEGYHIEVREANEETEESQMYVEQVGADGESVEHILEIPENAEQCQILLFPNGTFKVLNVDGGEEAVQIMTEEGETIWQEASEAEVVEAAMAVKHEEGNEVEQEEGESTVVEVREEEGEEEVVTMDEAEVMTLENGDVVRVARIGRGEGEERLVVTELPEGQIVEEVQQQVAIISNTQ